MATDELQKVFNDKISQEIKIEPKDWIPENYRKTLIRQMSQHAHSELLACFPKQTGEHGRQL